MNKALVNSSLPPPARGEGEGEVFSSKLLRVLLVLSDIRTGEYEEVMFKTAQSSRFQVLGSGFV